MAYKKLFQVAIDVGGQQNGPETYLRTRTSYQFVGRLSDRELEIFRLLGQGRTTSQIAGDLNLSLKTVQAYCARAKEKFGVTSLT